MNDTRVSNFCQPPHQAKHNEGIWKNGTTLVLVGAHGFLTGGVLNTQNLGGNG